MTSALDELRASIEAKNEHRIIKNLSEILAQDCNIELTDNNIAKGLIQLNNNKITKLFVEFTADMCRLEHNRKVFTDKFIIDYYLELLDARDDNLIIGTIRALGNICYENEEARNIIGKRAFPTLLTILRTDHEHNNQAVTEKASGFLVNLLLSNDELQKAALQEGIVDTVEILLKKYICSYEESKVVLIFLLNILNAVVDYIDEFNIPFGERLCCTLIEIFKMATTPEMSVTVLEILHGQTDKDEIKTLLAKHHVCELVFDLIEKYREKVNDEDTRSVMKMACDFIVIILTGDDCMFLLYDDGKGKLYEDMLKWLDSDDSDLLSTGVLALGNFARKDTHCTQMVENGISKKLLDILAKNNTKEGDIKVQHALLSTLKNLVIPPQNKAKILSEGLIDIIYPMIEVEQYLVVFKLLGTFRMAIDGQEKEALDLLSRKEFLKKIVNWCYYSDHLGVRGEVPRLLAWLIRDCHSIKPFADLIRIDGTVKCLVEMTSSNHAVMQNESLHALNLLCTSSPFSDPTAEKSNGRSETSASTCLSEKLISADIGKNLHFVINKYGEKMGQTTIENLLTLLEKLVTYPPVADNLKAAEVKEALTKLCINPDHSSNVMERLISIKACLSC